MNENDKKFIESYNIEDYEIFTDTNWEPITHIHKTIPYIIYNLKTETGKTLSCADDHILMDETYNEIFVKDIIVNETTVITIDGPEKIISLIKTLKEENMYDVTVNSFNHTLYTNNILSHNTTIMSIYALWIACFNSDKRVLIVANKEDTAIMILRRIRMAYEQLPNWLKPGVKQWGKTELVLANDSSINISTTTTTAARGESCSVLVVDEMAHIPEHIIEEFWNAVIPVVSSALTTKVFICSTPNGSGNLFHKIYSQAERGELSQWHHERIDWWEIPGRGKKWKKDMEDALAGSNQSFSQEFGNSSGGQTKIAIRDEKGYIKDMTLEEFYRLL